MNMETAIEIPKAEAVVGRDLVRTQDELSAWANALEIETADDHRVASERLREVKKLRRAIIDAFEPHLERMREIKRQADAARRAIEAERDKALGPIGRIEAVVGDRIVAWEQEQERRRREELARLVEERRKREEEERLRLAEQAKLSGADEGTVNAILDGSVPVDVPDVPAAPETPAPPRVDGIRTRVYYRAQIDPAMAKACAVELIKRDLWPREKLLKAVQPVADAAARSMREAAGVIPGLTVVKEVKKELGR